MAEDSPDFVKNEIRLLDSSSDLMCTYIMYIIIAS